MATKTGMTVDVYDTSAELDPSEPIGQLALTLNPLTLWVFTSTGYVAVGSPSGSSAPSPASEAGQGVVELAAEAEVQAGSAGILVATAAGLKAELDRRAPVTATETASGLVELATATETSTGTDTTRAVHPAGLKAAMTPGAWIAPEHRQKMVEALDRIAAWKRAGSPDNEEGRYVKAFEENIRGRIAEVRRGGGTSYGSL
jgi:hypothetical protein